jgi:hypothetical protein
VRNFTPNFTETVKPLQKFIRKDADFKWDEERKGYFNDIDTAISQALVLRGLTLAIIFSFIPLLLTNPWLQYLHKSMVKKMRHKYPL